MVGLSLVLAGFSATAMGGGAFFDDFDGYADQAALDASLWDPADGMANGQLNETHAFGRKAMRCQGVPETRPTRLLGDGESTNAPSPGLLNLWFYDDGVDIKGFDIRIKDGGTNTASVGLNDSVGGSATNYRCGLNGVYGDTGIARSTGWHLVQFAVHSTNGTVIQIDGKNFTGNSLPALTAGDAVTIYTNYPTPEGNYVWIDSVQWIEGDASAALPAGAHVGTIENFDTLSTTAWTPMTGTTEADLHHITDAGSDGTPLGCIDVFDGGADRGFQGTLSGVVPLNGKYRLSFDYENGGDYGGGIGPWENLTVTMNGTSSVNVGSAQVSNWAPAETTSAVDLTTADNVNIQVTADSTGSTGFCRLDTLSLILTEVTVPPASVSDWQLYGSDSDL